MSKPKSVPGQGEVVFDQFGPAGEVMPESFTFAPSDFDSPATSLADYYEALAGAVRAIGRARGNQDGFSQLSIGSEPVKEYAYRLDLDPPDAKAKVVTAEKKHRTRGQLKYLNRRNEIEYDQLVRYARATGAFTVEEVSARMPLPPSIDDVEFKYFKNPDLTPEQLEKKRQQLYRRAKSYNKPTPARVA